MAAWHAGQGMAFNGASEKAGLGLEETLLQGKQCASNAIYLFTSQLSKDVEEPPVQRQGIQEQTATKFGLALSSLINCWATFE